MGLTLTRLKPIKWGRSDIIDPYTLASEIGFHPNFTVWFNYSLKHSEIRDFNLWAADNIDGRIHFVDRVNLGPTGEVLFENEEDALMFFLHYS